MWLATVAVLLMICFFFYLDTVKPKNYPPGPKWTPIVGCALEVYELRKKTGYLYQTVKELSRKYCQEGPLLGLRIGKDYIVMVNGLDANKEMLYNEDIDGRPKGIFYQTRTWGERRGVLLTDGGLWKEQRRFLLKHLKEFGFGRSGMGEIARFEAAHMIEDILSMMKNNENNNGIVVQMHNFFNTYVLNTLWTMMAGLRYDAKDPEMRLLQNLLFDLFATVDMVGALFSHFPVLSVLAPKLSGYKNFMHTHKRIWKFLREELARHKDRFHPDQEDKDIMDVYIRILNSIEKKDTYSEGQLIAMCMDMFMAGTETTSKSLSFCFSYLVREQKVQERARAEIDEVLGKRMPNLDDRNNMPYNEAVVHECIRHFMGRTFGVPHRALRDTNLAGYFIPKDTMVVNNYTNILMDENYYPEPYSFRPERFLCGGKVCLPDQYFPFGLAKHRCLGDVLAKCNIFIFTTSMLQKFRVLPAPGEPMPSLDHVDGATPSAAPFKSLMVPRNHEDS